MDTGAWREKRLSFPGGIGTILAGLVLAFLLVHVAGRFWIEQKIQSILTPEQYNRLNAFETEPLNLPPDYFNPPPIPELVQQKWDKFLELYERDRAKIKDNMFNGNVATGDSFLQEELDEARVNAQNAEPFVNALLDLANTPGYNSFIFEYYWDYKLCHYLDIELVIGLTHKLNILEIENNFSDAIQYALEILKIARHHPAQTDLFPHGFVYTSIKHIGLSAPECKNREAIEMAFTTLVQEENKVLSQNPSLEFEKATISMLHYAHFNDPEFTLPQGKPLMYYYEQSLPYQEQRIKDSCGMSTPAQPWDEIAPIYFGLKSSVRRLHISRIMSDSTRTIAVYQETNARYYTIMTYLASRLYEIDTGQWPTKPEDIVPKYLPAIPIDPFTNKPLLWDSENHVFYSIGPDLADNKNRIPYTGTGKVVAGDIDWRTIGWYQRNKKYIYIYYE